MSESISSDPAPRRLQARLQLGDAILLGLGSIVGTGVFVSLGLAAGLAGPAVLLAVAIAAVVALCNGLSSAQLAASHPVSGGSYEYGYRYLNPRLGFLAGWLFLIAKSASAATAALGFAAYALQLSGGRPGWLVPLALLAVLGLTLLVLGGLQRSNLANTVVVGLTLLSLLVFVLAGLPQLSVANLTPFFSTAAGQPVGLAALLQASALLFVAYTGYGRIATLGEEVHAPRQTIPRAMLITLLLTMLLYVSVATVGISVVGADGLSGLANKGAGGLQAAPLAVAAAAFKIPGVALIVSLGAVTAMLGVVLNLILGLSRVLMAMGRRRDMPTALARLNAAGSSPPLAVLAVGLLIAGLVLTGNIQTTWSFSAFNVLIYYALTNLAALRLPPAERLYPRWMAWLGLLSCSSLAFWVETHIWLLGLALIAAGLLWQQLARQLWPHDSTSNNMS